MHKNPIFQTVLVLLAIAILTLIVYYLPPVHNIMAWRMERFTAYVRGVVNPIGAMPTPVSEVYPSATPAPTLTATPDFTPTPTKPGPTATPLPSPTPIPPSVSLPIPAYEKQDANNCGPATLTMYLRMFGWQGTQADIAELIKPNTEDRNVNVDELVYYVRTHVGWLNIDFRVGGDIQELKTLLAAGFPVMIEEGMKLDKAYWPNDDLWAGHYLLLTGYDDAAQQFLVQDSFYQDSTTMPYQTLDKNWRQFNRVFIIANLPNQSETIKSLLGENWGTMEASRQHALDTAQAEADANPKDGFAWFNIGSNLVFFDKYAEAARAYDSARQAGLPQRMLRYQFGPFFAYFNAVRTDDLIVVTEYALKITPNSEEALLWHGWGLFRKGDKEGAMRNWQDALKNHPGYQDAMYAIDFLNGQ